MRVAFLFILLFLLLFTFNYAYAQEPIIMEQVTPNGMVKVQLFWPEVLPNQLYNIELRFLNPQTNEPITDLIVYNVAVTQNEELIEFYEEEYAEDGKALFEVFFPENGIGPAQVIVGIVTIDFGTTSTNINESVFFNVQVVPEFSALLSIVMVVALLTAVLLGRNGTNLVSKQV